MSKEKAARLMTYSNTAARGHVALKSSPEHAPVLTEALSSCPWHEKGNGTERLSHLLAAHSCSWGGGVVSDTRRSDRKLSRGDI